MASSGSKGSSSGAGIATGNLIVSGAKFLAPHVASAAASYASQSVKGYFSNTASAPSYADVTKSATATPSSASAPTAAEQASTTSKSAPKSVVGSTPPDTPPESPIGRHHWPDFQDWDNPNYTASHVKNPSNHYEPINTSGSIESCTQIAIAAVRGTTVKELVRQWTANRALKSFPRPFERHLAPDEIETLVKSFPGNNWKSWDVVDKSPPPGELQSGVHPDEIKSVVPSDGTAFGAVCFQQDHGILHCVLGHYWKEDTLGSDSWKFTDWEMFYNGEEYTTEVMMELRIKAVFWWDNDPKAPKPSAKAAKGGLPQREVVASGPMDKEPPTPAEIAAAFASSMANKTATADPSAAKTTTAFPYAQTKTTPKSKKDPDKIKKNTLPTTWLPGAQSSTTAQTPPSGAKANATSKEKGTDSSTGKATATTNQTSSAA